MRKDRRGCPIFDNTAKVHDGDGMGQILDDAEIVRNEEIRKLITCLEVAEQVEDLRLH